MSKLHTKQTLNQIANILILTLMISLIVTMIFSFLSNFNFYQFEKEYRSYEMIVISVIIMILLWKIRVFNMSLIFYKSKRKMRLNRFIFLLGVMLFVQILSAFILQLINLILQNFGYSMQKENAVIVTPGICLYICIIGPIFEELLFRGIILNLFKEYNILSGILISASLFCIYHGNLNQRVSAFFIGIVFAYIAKSYSIYWTALLHMINNMLSIILQIMNEKDKIVFIEVGAVVICLYSVIYFWKEQKILLEELGQDAKEKIRCKDIFQSRRFVIIALVYTFLVTANIDKL